ncbi:c-type cytochrome biogenesis protein CcmI [Rodentibacter caecimuris]|uniref:C-type cytochrome biogenesis protein CcmI n=1 Tax=Rodentibacter caecimuris TaxID=1796644 RepID=A0ABX3L0F7_9PAST|nr:c-type cytochrome biogenesis protein CcmI [Rodentibacter heylii]OOF71086.1 c-type cytochrome biogenesis protein CcmI [Rodentibacter heylii]
MSIWIYMGLITLIIAVLCFYPLLLNHQEAIEQQRDELNKMLYRSRLIEIEREEAQGLLNNVEQVKQDLQKILLEDIPNKPVQVSLTEKRYGRIWFVSGFLCLAIVSGVVYSMVGAWKSESMLVKTYQKLPYFYERLKEEETKPLNDSEMQQFATALRFELQKNPSDPKKWWLLGQLGMNLDNPQLAFQSYRQAYEQNKENTEYKLAYARLLMFSDDPRDKVQGSDLLRQVIRQDHSNLEALSLLAFRYFETEDYKMAAVTWAMMLRLMPPDDKRVPLIEKSIRAARDALTLQEEEKNKSVISHE